MIRKKERLNKKVDQYCAAGQGVAEAAHVVSLSGYCPGVVLGNTEPRWAEGFRITHGCVSQPGITGPLLHEDGQRDGERELADQGDDAERH